MVIFKGMQIVVLKMDSYCTNTYKCKELADMRLLIEEPKTSVKRLLELIRNFGRVAG